MVQPKHKSQANQGVWRMVFGGAARIVRILLLSMLFAPLFAIAVTAIQPDGTNRNAASRLDVEVRVVDEAFRDHLLFQSRSAPARKTSVWIDRIYKGFASRLPLVSPGSEDSHAQTDLFLPSVRLGLPINQLVDAASTALQNWAVRLLALVGATPLFAVVSIVCVTDGLVRRDIRRWSAGRESAFVYHFGKMLLLPAVGWTCALILCAPTAVSLHFWIWGTAMCLGLGVSLMASRFRKYL